MRLQVAVGVLRNLQGEVLIAKRPDNVHLGGFWEFPGGKLERNENTKQALLREFKEELGIQIVEAQPLIQVQHNYADCQVLLDVWQIKSYLGEVAGREGQKITWVKPEHLSDFSFPEANQAIIKAIK